MVTMVTFSGYLGDDVEGYGKQRMFGSLGWGIAMFIVGIALDQSNFFIDHPCGNTQAGKTFHSFLST